MDLAAPLVPELIKCLNVDDENVINLIGVYIMIYGRVSSGQNVAAPYLENLIVAYLEKGNQNLLSKKRIIFFNIQMDIKGFILCGYFFSFC